MLIIGKDKKVVVTYLKQRYPIGTEIWDGNHLYTVKKTSVFIVYSDKDEVSKFDPKFENYCLTIRDAEKKSHEYLIQTILKRWVEDLY